MEYGATPVVAESNEEIYVNLLHGVAIGIILDILLDVCEYCIGCYSILWDIVDIVLGCYGIYWMLADIPLGLSEECLMLEAEFNRFSLTLAVWTKISETTLLQWIHAERGCECMSLRTLLSTGTLGAACIRSYWISLEAVRSHVEVFSAVLGLFRWDWAEGSVSELREVFLKISR